MVDDPDNIAYPARVLLNCRSQSSFETEYLKRKLNIKSTSTKLRRISGFINSMSTTTDYCILRIKSRIIVYTTNTHCMIIENIAENLTCVEVNPNELNIPNNKILHSPTLSFIKAKGSIF